MLFLDRRTIQPPSSSRKGQAAFTTQLRCAQILTKLCNCALNRLFTQREFIKATCSPLFWGKVYKYIISEFLHVPEGKASWWLKYLPSQNPLSLWWVLCRKVHSCQNGTPANQVHELPSFISDYLTPSSAYMYRTLKKYFVAKDVKKLCPVTLVCVSNLKWMANVDFPCFYHRLCSDGDAPVWLF